MQKGITSFFTTGFFSKMVSVQTINSILFYISLVGMVSIIYLLSVLK